MELQDKVALITGGKRIGVVVAGQLAARGVDVALGYARSRDEAEQAARSVRASGRRAEIVQADLSQPDALRRARRARPRRNSDASTSSSTWRRSTCARPFDELTAADWDGAAQRRPARGVSLRARRRAAHAAPGRRPHRQLQRLDRAKRPAALSRLPAVLRGEGRRDRR